MNDLYTHQISAIVTFHNEGLLAHKTLLGLERLRRYAESAGASVELVAVLDNVDKETARVVNSSPVMRSTDQVITVYNGDQGASRNSGVAAAIGRYVGLFDGDDYHSENWLWGALNTVEAKQGDVIAHPDYVASFGAVHSIGQIPDMDITPGYPLANCFSVHPWVSSSFGKKEIYMKHPYSRTDTQITGFGFEDWHWNLELLGNGVRHVTAPQTALFYRRKATSVLVYHLANNAIVRPSRFFTHPEQWGELQRNSSVITALPSYSKQ